MWVESRAYPTAGGTPHTTGGSSPVADVIKPGPLEPVKAPGSEYFVEFTFQTDGRLVRGLYFEGFIVSL